MCGQVAQDNQIIFFSFCFLYAKSLLRKHCKEGGNCHNLFLGSSKLRFLFFKKKKTRLFSFFPAHAKSGKKKIFWKCFSAHFLSLPLHKTLSKPIPTQPYPANVTIKERDTMPCKHSRPPYPAEVRQPVPPCTTMGQSGGGSFSSSL